MTRAQFEDYLAKFNACDYEAVLGHFTEDFILAFAGYALRGREAFYRFYRFFHEHARESVILQAFAASHELVAIEAIVRLEGIRDLTPEALAAQGLDRLVSIQTGQVIEIPQFIHYRLRDGKFAQIVCAIVEDAQDRESGTLVTQSA